MRDDKYIITVLMPDETYQQFVVFEPREIGSYFKGGKVSACRHLTKMT